MQVSCDFEADLDGLQVAIVGCGKMGEAILKGWLASDVAPASGLHADSFAIVQPSDRRRRSQQELYGVAAVGSVAELAGLTPGSPSAGSLRGQAAYDMVVLAVKPQAMSGVLEELASVVNAGDGAGADAGVVSASTLFVTIAAGIPTADYEHALSSAIDGPRVVRVMPNMPLQVGMGASALAGGAYATGEDVELVRALFAALGESVVVSEDQMDAVCAISGGGPAYFAYMVEALGAAGRELGLDGDLAERLALATLGGTYHAIVDGGTTPSAMRESVCSPGGTTLAALSSMDSDGFASMMASAMHAAVTRARELREDG